MKLTLIEPAAPLGVSPDHTGEVTAEPEERHDGWTPGKQAAFLQALAATHCVSEAARSVGMSRQSAYKLRARLKGEPFDIAWQAAFRLQYDALLEATVERAIKGVEVPHFHKGELIHTSRRFDERAAVALLAMRSRMAAPLKCWRAEKDKLNLADFQSLVDRVEYGDEYWDVFTHEDDLAEEQDLDGGL